MSVKSGRVVGARRQRRGSCGIFCILRVTAFRCIFCILRVIAFRCIMQYLHSLHLCVIAFRCIICCIMCIRGMTAYLLQFMRARTLGKCTTQTPPPSPQVPPRLLPPPLPSPLPTPSASPPPLLLPRGMTAYLLQFEGKNLRQVHPDSSPSPLALRLLTCAWRTRL